MTDFLRESGAIRILDERNGRCALGRVIRTPVGPCVVWDEGRRVEDLTDDQRLAFEQWVEQEG
jgi:hypothetical protein